MDLSTLPMSAALASRPPRISGSDIGTARRPGVLALDLGTATGWALRSGDGAITSGTMTFRPSRFEGGGMRYLRLRRWLDDLQRDAGPIGAIHFEEVRRHIGTDAAHIYGGMLGVLSAWCEEHGVAYQGVPVGTIKAFAAKRMSAVTVARHAVAFFATVGTQGVGGGDGRLDAGEEVLGHVVAELEAAVDGLEDHGLEGAVLGVAR